MWSSVIRSGRIFGVRLVSQAGESLPSDTIVKLRLSSLAQIFDDMGFPVHAEAILELMRHADDRSHIEAIIRICFGEPSDAEQAIDVIFAPHEPRRL